MQKSVQWFKAINRCSRVKAEPEAVKASTRQKQTRCSGTATAVSASNVH